MKKYKESPDTDINWSNPEEVDNYYLSFEKWKGVVRIGDSKNRQVYAVKDNKVFSAGEYYLPYYSHHIKDTEKRFVKDGFIFGFCVKIYNAFWGKQETKNTVNVFVIEHEITPEMYSYYKNKMELYNQHIASKLSIIEYLNSLNKRHINSRDLDLFKSNYALLFKDIVFPYVVQNGNKPVVFSKRNGDNKITVTHRNRSGQLEIDNGYHGQMPFNNDYNVFLYCRPHFTNVLSASYARVESNELNFDIQTLDSMAKQIISVWDVAIEKNYRNY
jgi:hypothetical protein